DAELIARVAELATTEIEEAYSIADKQARYKRSDEITASIIAQLNPESSDIAPRWEEQQIKNAIESLKGQIVRERIIAGKPRIDGRNLTTVRPITIRTGVLPRTHGSALFTRGETQALVITTLGTEKDSQVVDGLEGERREHFMLHYNFPPFCVGEIDKVGNNGYIVKTISKYRIY
ncbi:polynucleotide phosphorylase/polyadenylase, partial [Achromatium sp. WMS1]